MPTVDLAVAINEAVREGDEWFDESDDLERLARAIDSVGDEVDPIAAAGKLAFRVAHAQTFGEGIKRTARTQLTKGGELTSRSAHQDDRRSMP